MELMIDIGQDVYDDLEKAAKIEEKNLQSAAAAMLSLGVKVYLNSKEDKLDSTTKLLLKNSALSTEILTEVLHIVFDKNKSNLGVYDADTALALIDRMAAKFVEGAE